jgi:hypothetical protein
LRRLPHRARNTNTNTNILVTQVKPTTCARSVQTDCVCVDSFTSNRKSHVRAARTKRNATRTLMMTLSEARNGRCALFRDAAERNVRGRRREVPTSWRLCQLQFEPGACCGFDLCHKHVLYLYLYIWVSNININFGNTLAQSPGTFDVHFVPRKWTAECS